MAAVGGEVSRAGPSDAFFAQATDYFQTKQWVPALVCFEQALKAGRNTPEVHNYRARAFEALKRYTEALACLDQALALDPTNVADRRNRAIVLIKLSRTPEAVTILESLLDENPGSVDLLVRLALALNQVDQRERALSLIDRALELRPNDTEVFNARVIILDNLMRYAEALEDLDRILAINRDHIDAINNVGMVLARIGRYQDALTCYQRSLSLKPDQPQALYNRSLVHLALGDWIRGFKEFECRWNAPPLNTARPTGLGPLWLGDQDLRGKALLVYHEQGYGDSLLCVRFLSLVAERGARVILGVPQPLERLMKSVPGVATVVSQIEALPEHDYQIPLMSMMLAFRTTPDTVPTGVPYLFAEPELIEKWRRRLASKPGPRIGLCWGGRRYAPINYPRDVPVPLIKLLMASGATFVSLQKEIGEAERQELTGTPNLLPLAEECEDFADTAGLIANLDLVITVDSAIAHLAGALGKPVWLMNRHSSCWRWMQSGDGPAWYPKMRQFRQERPGDWSRVLAAISQELQAFLATYSPTPTRPAIEPKRSLPSKEHSVAKFRFVVATRRSREEFFKVSPLGRSLLNYRRLPIPQSVELRVTPNNAEGLPVLYNRAIEEAKADPAILIFVHDDVYLTDHFWPERITEALKSFGVVGLAGNRRRVPRQPSWMHVDEDFRPDDPSHLSGIVGHGEEFPNLKQLSVYGPPGRSVKLLDGVFLAADSRLLIDKELRFDPRFAFHFYDMDFCRQAELRGITMGTCKLSAIHASGGRFGTDSWKENYRTYLSKYREH